jgi:hypothetical protein
VGRNGNKGGEVGADRNKEGKKQKEKEWEGQEYRKEGEGRKIGKWEHVRVIEKVKGEIEDVGMRGAGNGRMRRSRRKIKGICKQEYLLSI